MIDAIDVIDAIDANDLNDVTDMTDVIDSSDANVTIDTYDVTDVIDVPMHMRRRSVQSARPHPVGSDTGHFPPNRSHCQRHFLHGRAVAAS